MCQAVGYAHAHRVIHRDLKPANVMVGAFGEVQVMDWGLAKVLGEETPATAGCSCAAEETQAWTQVSPAPESGSYTQAGSLVGTPAFIPPEQAGGEIERVNERSDVFGLGAFLTVILTGKPPYVGETFESVRVQAVRGKLEDCFARLDACGAEPELVALCKKCLAFEPADRPADAGAVAAAVAGLRAAADERARQAELDRVQAEGETREAQARAAEQRRRRRILLRAIGIIALVFLVGFASSPGNGSGRKGKKTSPRLPSAGKQAQRAIALEEADRATREADRSRRLLYASDMSLALHAWEAGTLGHARARWNGTCPRPARTTSAASSGATSGASARTAAGIRCAATPPRSRRSPSRRTVGPWPRGATKMTIVCGSGTWPRGAMSSSWDTGGSGASSAVPWPSRRTVRPWPSPTIRPGRFISGTCRPGASELPYNSARASARWHFRRTASSWPRAARTAASTFGTWPRGGKCIRWKATPKRSITLPSRPTGGPWLPAVGT